MNLDTHTGLIIIEKRSVVCRSKEKPPGIGEPMPDGRFEYDGRKRYRPKSVRRPSGGKRDSIREKPFIAPVGRLRSRLSW
ncbi:hypothetical protein CDO73_09425 [Saccharibacillus sp. O23]|nr:hypothetical protein CDO73_09425 [Saccharibacillus sp. O23]